MAALALKQPSILIVIVADVATYILSLGVILTLRDPALEESVSSKGPTFSTAVTVREILAQRGLAPHFIAVCLSQAIFQGAYSVLVSYLPITRFQLGVQGLGAFQIAASLGIIVGFLVVWQAPNLLGTRENGKAVAMLVTLAFGIVSIIACIAVQSIGFSLLWFFLVNASYECLWLYSSSEFFRNSSPNTLGRYQFVLTSSASCVMAVFTFFYATLIELAGLHRGVMATLTIGILIWACVSYFTASVKTRKLWENPSHD
jgi:hypothetical protein